MGSFEEKGFCLVKERGIEGKGLRYRGGRIESIEEKKGLTCEGKGY